MTLAVFQTTVQNAVGDAIPSAQVTVRLGSSSGALASLFSDNAGATPITNPFNADTNGFARFFAAPGVYWISITGGGSTQVLERVVLAGDAASRNVLGTVSQSGGLPTGAIIQRGSNANGEFVRFADGTQICTREVQHDFSTIGDTDYSLPIPFVGEPSASASFQLTTAGGRLDAFKETVAMGSLTLIRIANRASTRETLRVNLTAIGRWF